MGKTIFQEIKASGRIEKLLPVIHPEMEVKYYKNQIVIKTFFVFHGPDLTRLLNFVKRKKLDFCIKTEEEDLYLEIF